MTLFLIRHGATHDATGKCVGWTDVPLSEAGKETLLRLGGMWQGNPPDALWSSDLQRSDASAMALRQGAGWLDRVPTQEARLRELHFGAWEGRTWTDLEQSEGSAVRDWMERWTEAAPPQGETFSALRQRTRSWLDSLRQTVPEDGTGIAVIHAGSLRAILCEALALDSRHAFDFACDHAHLFCLKTIGNQWQLTLANATSWP
jgi:broad specificity phosphatase PhoE